MSNTKIVSLWIGAIIMLLAMVHYDRYVSNVQAQTKEIAAMRLTSPHFEHNSSIPSRFTCEGEDVSPALSWDNVPHEAKSFVLIVDDPDAPDPKAPKMTWVHWVVYNIPADKRSLKDGEHIAEAQLGVNDFQNKTQTKYGGPCPPIGEHRYFFKLYALDTMLDLQPGARKQEVLTAMQGHVLASAEVIGLYKKK